MLSQCIKICTLTVLLSSSVQSKPAVIYGNAHGLWSPTHPHLTSGQDKPNSPVLYTLPPPPQPVEEPVISETPDVCPTLQSAPHLCPPT